MLRFLKLCWRHIVTSTDEPLRAPYTPHPLDDHRPAHEVFKALRRDQQKIIEDADRAYARVSGKGTDKGA